MADWETLAAQELDRLTNPHAAKKRGTVIALVDARLSGATEESVWIRTDTCSRTVYHTKWKRDPVFAEVLETVTALARQWRGRTALRALAQAAERLALASPVAVARAIAMLQSTDEQVVLRAAFGILDRAGVETATKGKLDVASVEMTLEQWRAEQAKLRQQAAQTLADFADEE